MIRSAKDLTPDQKAVVESMLGRRILEDEAVSVRAIAPPALTNQRRRELAEELRNYFAELDAQRPASSADDAEAILTEAMRSTRPGYRSHR